VTTPKSGDLAHPPGISDSARSTAVLSLSNTSFNTVPFYIHIILKWSSSPHQIMNFLSSEW
jgi:hypothetical protein